MPPILSIVTPCLNAARFLPRCLESVVRAAGALPEGSIEHIMMDGGSTDGSADVIREHAAKHPKLIAHWQSSPDSGQSAAINAGFAMARGEFGAWLNADDWYEESSPAGHPLARVIRTLESLGDGVDVLLARARIVDERGRVVWSPKPPERLALADLLRVRSRWYAGRGILQPEAFIRLETFRAAGGLNAANALCMDYQLWTALAARGARFECVDVLVASQLAHAGQKTADRVQTLRAALGVAEHALAESRAKLGRDATVVEMELSAIRAKLAIADAVLPVWARGTTMDGPRPSQWRASAERVLREAVVVCPNPGRPRALAIELDSAEQDLVRHVCPHAERIEQHGRNEAASPADLVIIGRNAIAASAPSALTSASLRSAGTIVLLPVPASRARLSPYLAWLERTLIGNLAADDGTLVHPSVDAALGQWAHAMRIELHERRDQPSANPAGSDWLDGFNSYKPLSVETLGGPEDHPLTPFPFVGPQSVCPAWTWIAGAWRTR